MNISRIGLRTCRSIGDPALATRQSIVFRGLPLCHLPDGYQASTSPQRRGLLTTTFSDPGSLAVIPANVMTMIHSIGVPWLITIPASAFLFRSTLVWPMIRGRRQNMTKAAMLQPLIDANLSHAVLDRSRRSNLRYNRPDNLTQLVQKTLLRQTGRKKRSSLESKLDIPTRPILSKVIPILILLVVSEAVRRLCDDKDGLLVLLLGAFGPVLQPFIKYFLAMLYWFVIPIHEPNAWQRAKGRAGLETVKVEQRARSVVDQSLPSEVKSSYQALGIKSWAQPSLKGAGLPWCRDLTAPDTTMFLPLVFTSTMFASVAFAPRPTEEESAPKSASTSAAKAEEAASRSTKAPKPRYTGLQKFFLGVIPFTIFPAMQMPAAMLIYFISNIAMARVFSQRAARMFPITPPPLACSRRARMTNRTEYI